MLLLRIPVRTVVYVGIGVGVGVDSTDLFRKLAI